MVLAIENGVHRVKSISLLTLFVSPLNVLIISSIIWFSPLEIKSTTIKKFSIHGNAFKDSCNYSQNVSCSSFTIKIFCSIVHSFILNRAHLSNLCPVSSISTSRQYCSVTWYSNFQGTFYWKSILCFQYHFISFWRLVQRL